jgi:hypothetical protein
MASDKIDIRKNAFVDPGYESGRVFAKFFFSSPDVHINTLKQLVRADSRTKKDALATELSRLLADGEVDPATILRALARQSRQWLSIRLGRPQQYPSLLSPEKLLIELGGDGWYGPILDEDGSPKWYIRSSTIPHFFQQGKNTLPASIRWLTFAEIGKDHTAYSWNNFTHATEERVGTQSQFPFWLHIPEHYQTLETSVGGTWELPNLHKLVLVQLWEAYMDKPQYRWQHLRVRAEFKGVALNAHSAGVADVDVRGLEALTAALAQSAARAIGFGSTPQQRKKLESGILRTLIQEWGTNSYEFRLTTNAADTPSRDLFHAHCYFGLRQNLATEDSLQHAKCYMDAGGHLGARDFILRHL